MKTKSKKDNQAKFTVKKYAQHAPRYTSYPTALKFEPVDNDILHVANTSTSTSNLSLYIHIPFCNTLCYYCGCNKMVTRHPEKADEYLRYLDKELKSALLRNKKMVSLHLGGGSPSFLSAEQHALLMNMLKKHVEFVDDAELSIELDPRNVQKTYLKQLKLLGYNRLSFGLQDTDYNVQKTINRVQSTAHIAALLFEARTLGFSSINLDLIYGLPNQSIETFKSTIAATKAMQPDRISLFSYAHLPERFASQRKFSNAIIPQAELKAELYNFAVESLKKSGYEMIGLDHFAKPTDALAVAKNAGELHRNFQGYTTHGNSDLLGIGVSSISTIGNVFAQNPKKLTEYYARVDNREPTATIGLALSTDDLIRRDVISSLMCNLRVDKKRIEDKHTIVFDDYFLDALSQLDPMAYDGLVDINPETIDVPEHARIYIRSICAKFDAYLNSHETITQYSKAI